jgi:L-seryl-tRNA(Ser) seleniumtransferase
VLGALQATALAYLAGNGDAIPFWRMAAFSVEELRAPAAALGVGTPVDTDSTPGGGTLPEVAIPSAGVAIDGDHRETLRQRGRPLIARMVDGRTIVDLRTVDPLDDDEVAAALGAL